MDEPEDRSEATQGGAESAQGAEDGARMRFSAATERYLDAAREQVRTHPLAAALAAFTAGCIVAIATRAARDRD